MKKTPRDIIILHKCIKNYDQMMHSSWDVVRERQMDRQTDGWMDGWMDRQTDRQTDGRTDEQTKKVTYRGGCPT